MGGGVALGVTLKFPQHVEKLTLVDSYGLGKKLLGGKLTYFASKIPFFYEVIRLSLQHSRFLTKLGVYNLFYNQKIVTGEIIDEAWSSLKAAGMHPIWKAFQNHEITFAGYRTCYLDFLRQIQCPILVIHGAQDRLVPVEWAKRAHKIIPNSELKIFENCGHLPPREKPEAFHLILSKFLSSIE